MRILSERLRELREQKGISMRFLSENVGISDAAICKWENAINEPKASNLLSLAQFFEVSTDYLLGLESDIGVKLYSTPLKKETAQAISPDGKELLDIYTALSPELRVQVLEYARYFAERSKTVKRK